jgi:hypothetical protein
MKAWKKIAEITLFYQETVPTTANLHLRVFTDLLMRALFSEPNHFQKMSPLNIVT